MEHAYALGSLTLLALWGALYLSLRDPELAFAFALGLMWSSLYEHVTWLRHA